MYVNVYCLVYVVIVYSLLVVFGHTTKVNTTQYF